MRCHDEPHFHREVSHPAYTAEGVLAASGLIAGEALMGLAVAAVVGLRGEPAFWNVASFAKIAPWLALPVAVLLAGTSTVSMR